MFRKFLNPRALSLAITIALTYCLFTGIFWSGRQPDKSQFDESHWYYLNRGVNAWSGVSLSSMDVPLPIIKAPFLNQNFYGNNYTKIIDLSVATPIFLIVFLVAYPFSLVVIRTAQKIKVLDIVFIPLQTLLLVVGICLYFFWFPRI